MTRPTTIYSVIPMTGTKDFEAIGRYVDAIDRVKALHSERHNLAAEISRAIRDASFLDTGSFSCETIKRFDHAKVEALATKIAETNIKLEAAIDEVNAYAKAASRPEIRRI